MMNARAEWAAVAAAVGFHRRGRLSRRPASSELASAIDALAEPLRGRDASLDEIRDALQGTALRWSKEGRLTFSPERMALVAQFDRLIDSFGGHQKVAALLR